MPFCSQCGKESEPLDDFCRRCGSKIPRGKTVEGEEVDSTLGDLRTLVDEAAKGIKKELLEQISEIEKGLNEGRLKKEEFSAEADEIRGRLMRFIKR